VWVALASLEPGKTWKNRTNGMREDLAEKVATMKPSFVRFPGGCYVEGNSLDQAFDWKKSLGPIEDRPGSAKRMWGYSSSDGLGFHDTYFYHRRILAGWRRERSGYAACAYDQGVGRALWFVAGGSALAAIKLLSALPELRHSDIWSGLGLAMTYAGAATVDDIAVACEAAGPHRTQFAQGIAFACEARVLARHVPAHTDLAARAVWGIGAEELSGLVRKARDRLPEIESDLPRYEIWRRAVAGSLSQTTGQHA